jgi:hypothetical protein
MIILENLIIHKTNKIDIEDIVGLEDDYYESEEDREQ